MSQTPAQPKPAKPKKDWRELRRVPLLQISASQVEEYMLCRRKWWLSNVRKLPVLSKGSQVFGTVLHSVLERFERADDLGNDRETGKPVELYPKDWHIARDRWKPEVIEGELDPSEQVALRKLVSAAIEQGVLHRPVDREVEYEFEKFPVTEIPCKDCKGHPEGDDCIICGCKPGEVHNVEKHHAAGEELGTGGDDPAFAAQVYDEAGTVNPVGCPTCNGTGKIVVQLKGFIDQLSPGMLEDHKSVKNMRWALSQKKLAKNTQLLLYAYVIATSYKEAGLEPPAKFTFRHNQYCKDPEDLRVRETSVQVPLHEIESHWVRTIEIAKDMASLRLSIDNWFQIAEPVNRNAACNAYGGCPFATICTGQENDSGYQKRLDKFLEGKNNQATVNPSDPSTHSGDKPMSDFAAMLAKRKQAQAAAAGGATTPTPTPAPTPTPTPAPTPTPTPTMAANPNIAARAAAAAALASQPVTNTAPAASADGMSAPPWADPTCAACKGVGFNSRGTPCRICDTKANQAGRLPSSAYIINNTDAGTAVWQKADDDTVAGESPLGVAAATTTVKAETRTAPTTPAAATPSPTETATTPADVAAAEAGTPALQPGPIVNTAPAAAVGATTELQQAQADAADTGDGKPGRPKKGFALYINCTPVRGVQRKGSGRFVYNLTDTLKDMHDAIAKDNGVESAYDVDVWKRRDAISKYAALIADDFGADIVVATLVGEGASDMRALVDGLRPYAGMEVAAVS